MSVWKNALFLFLGWLLGLLSPILVSQIERRRHKRVIGVGLRAELSELRFKLMCVAHLITIRTGVSDREFLLWALPVAREYEGLHAKDNILKGVEKLLELKADQLATLNALEKEQKRSLGMGLKKYQLLLLESQIHNLGLFNLTFQRVVLETRAYLASLNEDIDQARFFYEKTFDSSLSEENYNAVSLGLDNLYATIGKRARQLVDLIGRLPAA